METKPVYLDNNSTTRVDPAVVKRMLPFLSEDFGNASSDTHEYGRIAAKAVDDARAKVASLLGCRPKSIVFTSGATEANNLAILGAMRAAGKGKHLIVTAAEHKAVLDPAERLERDGYQVTVLSVDKDGAVDAPSVCSAIRPETVLVSVMHANNEIGTINPILEIAKACRRAGVLFHTDATQTVGKVPIDLSDGLVDMLSLSAHKMYGPKGIGALYVRAGSPRIQLEPLVEGGGHERRLRSGTLPVHQIVGLGEACRICQEKMRDEASATAELRDRLKRLLLAGVPGIRFNGHAVHRLPGNLHCSIPGARSEAVMMSVRNQLAISSGSACTTSSPEPSHVLRAIGLDASDLATSLRFGLGRFNTSTDVELAAQAIVESVRAIRELAGFKSC